MDTLKREKPISKPVYFAGLILILVFAYLQYVISGLTAITSAILVYGLPMLVISIIAGGAIIRKSLKNSGKALKVGLTSFALFSILTMILGGIIYFILENFDPSSLELLNNPNPVENVSPSFAWIMVMASLLIIGPVEEYIFRGYIFGGLLNVFKGRNWVLLAFISSLIFAAVHLYYALVYGFAASIAFTDLIGIGMALAITYYLSGGNLLVPALIHGAYDAIGYIGIATLPQIASFLRYAVIGLGLLIALILLLKRIFGDRQRKHENYFNRENQ